MREVRMTFGEHLEELRKRIIFALLYLTVGVAISMVYGTDLVEWALKPHYRAMAAAQRNRLIARMEQNVMKLRDEYTTMRPGGPAADRTARPLGADGPDGGRRWEVLFVRDVALPRLKDSLKAPYERFAGVLEPRLSAMAEEDRTATLQGLRDLAEAVADGLVSEFASELELDEASRIPDRFQLLEEKLSAAESETSDGATKIQRMLGWGKDLGVVLESLRLFNGFLERRREQVLQSEVPLATLRTWVQESSLPQELNPLLEALEKDADQVIDGTPPRIWVISYIESFAAYLKVALIIGALIALPGILYEMWKFIGAGLYPHEQKYVVTLMPFSLALFFVGMAFGYFIMIPVGLEFLAGWGVQNVELSFTLGNYVGLFFTLTLILGLVFQTPLLMIFFAKIEVLNVDIYRRGRRVAIFVGVILAVVLTPPDPFSWSLMACPMILLYEVGIMACRVLVKKKPAESSG